MGEILLLALLLGSVGGGIWFILTPLLPRRTPALGLAPVSGASSPSNEGALSSLEELDLDFQMGKLDEGDYRTFRESLVAVAGHTIDEQVRREQLELLIEAEVARHRSLPGDSRPPSPNPFDRLRAGSLPGGEALSEEADEGAATPGAKPGPGATRPANHRALLVAGVAAGLFLAATGILVANQLSRQTGQRPVATLEPGSYTALVFVAGDPDRLLVGSSDGVRASADGGRSWSPTTLSGNVRAVAAPATTAGPGGLLAAGEGLLATSADGGATWAAVPHDLPGSDVRALALDPRNPERVYAIVEGQGLFESADGGRRWARLSDRVPAGVASVAVVSGAPPSLYAATVGGGVQVSADNGRGWASANGFVSGALPTLRSNAIVYDGSSGDTYISSDGRIFRGALYVGTDQGLFKSIDGGSSWNRLPLRVAVLTLGMTADGRTLAAIDDGGNLFRSRDRGLSWGASE